MTRTMNYYSIDKDIDLYVATNWGTKIGKKEQTFTPMQIVQNSLDNESEVDRPVFSYPEGLVPNEAQKEKGLTARKRRFLNTPRS